jgi:uncharacterized protein YndB with AHSA1/START domain
MTNPTTITAQPAVPFIDVAREFDAPREAVYRAYADPSLVTQWMGPRRLTMEMTEWDVRPGGSWAWLHRDTDGTVFGFHGGVPRRSAGGAHPVDLRIRRGSGAREPRVGGLRGSRKPLPRHTHAVYQSVADRDAMLQGGMEGGMTEGFERMDELLRSLAAA